MYFEAKTRYCDEPSLRAGSLAKCRELIGNRINYLRFWRTKLAKLQVIALLAGPVVVVVLDALAGKPAHTLFADVAVIVPFAIVVTTIVPAFLSRERLDALEQKWYFYAPIYSTRRLTHRIRAWEMEDARQNAPDAQIG